MTPIQRDTLRKAGQQQPATAIAAAPLSLDRAMRYKLGSDRARLKKIASMQRKAEVKAEILPDYLPYVEGQMAAGLGDEVLTQVMIWAFDANELVTFAALARYALDNGVALPSEFARPLGAWLAESTAKLVMRIVDGSVNTAELGEDKLTALHDLVLWLERETAQIDMHDEVRAKLCRACGEILMTESPEQSLSYFENALRLDPHIRVKTRLKELKVSRAQTESFTSLGHAAAAEVGDVTITNPSPSTDTPRSLPLPESAR